MSEEKTIIVTLTMQVAKPALLPGELAEWIQGIIDAANEAGEVTACAVEKGKLLFQWSPPKLKFSATAS